MLAMYALLIEWEAINPARELPVIPYWRIKGLPFSLVFSFSAPSFRCYMLPGCLEHNY